MPIERSCFDIAKDPSDLILKFLTENQKEAFSVFEIRSNIPELMELKIPDSKISDTLDFLVRTNKVEFAFVKGTVYYSIKTFKIFY